MKNVTIVRKLFAVLLTLCCIALAINPASAATIEPRLNSCSYANAELKINSNSASCSIHIITKFSDYKITADMTLYRINGTTFTPLKTWSIISTHTISTSETFYVSHGYDYQVIAYITVKDSSGKKLESFTVNSPVVHY